MKGEDVAGPSDEVDGEPEKEDDDDDMGIPY
jgi:hypothetical protein